MYAASFFLCRFTLSSFQRPLSSFVQCVQITCHMLPNLFLEDLTRSPQSYDDALLNMVTIPEIFPNLHSKLGIIATIGNESVSPAKTDAAIKIKGFIFLEFANSLRSRRDRSFNVRRHHPK